MKTEKHIKGTTSLLLIASYFTSKGIEVFIPVDDFGECDLVIDDGKLKKVQVKTIYWDNSKKRYLLSLVTSHIRGNNRRINKKYNLNSFDLLAGIELKSGAIYLIPIEKVAGRRSMTIYLKDKEQYRTR